jgi:D-galactose 1-dehydrogenase
MAAAPEPIRIGIVGIGKIARDQHVPAIAASPDFAMICGASRGARSPIGNSYHDIAEMLDKEPTLQAVALCQPPQVRFEAARLALTKGKHVFLEKPPGATLSEVETLREIAEDQGVTLFASWHSRYAAGVTPARAWLAGKTIRSASIEWKEDVRHWHPGQEWIWQAGGLGVFDPGINALSIATHILPPFHLEAGDLSFPANRAAPIAADLRFALAGGGHVAAAFDWRQTGPQTWDIRIDTDAGELLLQHGGNTLTIAGEAVATAEESEYPSLYARFAGLIAAGRSDVDVRPLRHVADAFLRGEHRRVEAFEDEA